MTDANVVVNFSASTSDFESGLASAREALASLAAPISDISTNTRRLAQRSLSHTPKRFKRYGAVTAQPIRILCALRRKLFLAK